MADAEAPTAGSAPAGLAAAPAPQATGAAVGRQRLGMALVAGGAVLAGIVVAVVLRATADPSSVPLVGILEERVVRSGSLIDMRVGGQPVNVRASGAFGLVIAVLALGTFASALARMASALVRSGVQLLSR